MQHGMYMLFAGNNIGDFSVAWHRYAFYQVSSNIYRLSQGFHVPFDTKKVISDMLLAANLLA